MNSERFLANPRAHFSGAYEQFRPFGGPCVYFHRECLRAREQGLLSHRHVEMLYATLAAWGMHRMGDVDRTKTKLTEWDEFRESLEASAGALTSFRDIKRRRLRRSGYRGSRATAYGVFNLAYGFSWFAGSALMGWLYSRSITALIVFSVVVQLLAAPCFVIATRASLKVHKRTA